MSGVCKAIRMPACSGRVKFRPYQTSVLNPVMPKTPNPIAGHRRVP